MIWNSEAIRIFIVGLILMTVCSSLLGVMLGWRLRGYQIKVLEEKVKYLQVTLNRVWVKKATVGKIDQADPRYLGSVARVDAIITGTADECGARYTGSHRGESGWMKCSRPKGHDQGTNATKHGYAGVFWG